MDVYGFNGKKLNKGTAMKLTQLRGSEVLPVKRKELVGFDTCQKTEFRILGFNEAVSTIEQVSVEVDVEELARQLYVDECIREGTWEVPGASWNMMDDEDRKYWLQLAKVINNSKQKWLKLEVSK